jgi:hypothetical protein
MGQRDCTATEFATVGSQMRPEPEETILGLKVHPAATLFPLMEGEPFRELKDDIERHGLREPIVIDDDFQIVDGRNRARALAHLASFGRVELKGNGPGGLSEGQWVSLDRNDPYDFVISMNLHRRHLTQKERRELAATLAERLKAEQRMKPKAEKVDATRKAAELTGVSRATVAREEAKQAGKPQPSSLVSVEDTRRGAMGRGALEVKTGRSLTKPRGRVFVAPPPDTPEILALCSRLDDVLHDLKSILADSKDVPGDRAKAKAILAKFRPVVEGIAANLTSPG